MPLVQLIFLSFLLFHFFFLFAKGVDGEQVRYSTVTVFPLVSLMLNI